MYKQFKIAYVLCIHILLVVVLLKSDFIERVEHKIGISGQPEITVHFNRMLSYHSRMDANVPRGAIIFIGDSITQGLCVSAVITPSVNYGIGSDTSFGVLQRLPVYKSIANASAVVIAIGINDFIFRSNIEILKNYTLIVEQIPKRVPIIFSAVLPLDEKIHAKKWQGVNQNRIKNLNSKLKDLTAKFANTFFVDASPLLVDGEGNLSNAYYMIDGIHLNSQGNAIWIQELKKALEKSNKYQAKWQ